MWEMLDTHGLVGIYAASLLIPFSLVYFIERISDWWQG
ncbi:hypothetical protein Slip_1816 [Syntrophothermus lipocalidus DSM 12680]|uniref:Uncharacterized protein n=1 Tax=Syntrophothermus lipocalidus (strain DSM 12680 / TGB-C1) TaxID=643648 RepID=D7CPD6_SYNLT|nr:hypothetical protein Slip_1816 [Syntrophothermus lipocalidus DSM 12680]